MNFTKFIRCFLVASGAIGTLAAQDITGFHVGAALNLPGENLKNEITNKSFGGSLQAGYTDHLFTTGALWRANLSMNLFPGSERVWEGYLMQTDLDTAYVRKDSLRNVQLGLDILSKLPISGLRLVTGFSLNKWNWDSKAVLASDGTVLWDEKTSVKGIKMGARFGLDYQVTKNFSIEGVLQVVELGTDRESTKGINPSWYQFGARFHF